MSRGAPHSIGHTRRRRTPRALAILALALLHGCHPADRSSESGGSLRRGAPSPPVVTRGEFTPAKIEVALRGYIAAAPSTPQRIQTTFMVRSRASADSLAGWFAAHRELTVQVDTILPASAEELRDAKRRGETDIDLLRDTSWNVRVESPARVLASSDARAWIELILGAPMDSLVSLGGFGLEEP